MIIKRRINQKNNQLPPLSDIMNKIGNAERKLMKRRRSTYPVDKIFIERSSRYAMSGEPISDQELMILFEAARWAPSSYNNQPWRFIYAKRNSSSWQTLFDLLVKFNQLWAINAAVLIVIISIDRFTFNGKPSRTHSFDTGAAWENFALQGTVRGLVVHGMEGFNYDKAKKILDIPDEYTVEAMIAVGKPGKIENLPVKLQSRDLQISERLPLNKLVFEGKFTSTP